MTDHELDDLGRAALRRHEVEPDLWFRLRRRRSPTLAFEGLTCLLSGACALALLWFLGPARREAAEPFAPVGPPPHFASAEEKAIANLLAVNPPE